MSKSSNKHKIYNFLKKKRFVILFVIGFGLIGGLSLLISNAATNSISIEAESGSSDFSLVVSDPTASDGSAIQFGYEPIVIATAGDIATGATYRQEATANLIKRIHPTLVIPLGDNAYSSGTITEYNKYYAPYWGAPEILSISKPVPGNHEYKTAGAAGYFQYFDPSNTGKFGEQDKGYYSFVKGNWLFLNINSECGIIAGGCANGGAQAKWVDQQLAANPEKCVVASWHRPRITKGGHSDYTSINDIWNKIYTRKGIVLTGHNHLYTRSKPLGNNGVPSSDGILQFVVGTGGTGSFYTSQTDPARQAKEINETHGILKLTLQGNTYQYQFINTSDEVLDQGTGTAGC